MLPKEDIEVKWNDLVKYKMNSKCRSARRKLKEKTGGVKKEEENEEMVAKAEGKENSDEVNS
jgi:hypothetical protein